MQHMAGVHIAAVIWDVGCHCCCCIDTTRHVIRFTCQILRKVGLKPLETLSTNLAVITCWHPCWLRRSEEWWEMNTCVWSWTTSNFFEQDHIWLVHIHSSRKMPKMRYMIRVVHDEQNKWHVLQNEILPWWLNKYSYGMTIKQIFVRRHTKMSDVIH